MQMIEHPDFDSLSTTVAETLARACVEAIESRGNAVLALAGGSTPMPVYRRLAETELDWSRIDLLPGDDRWVAHDHPACNLRAMRDAFSPVAARFRALTPEHPDAAPDTEVAEATLAELGSPFDACVLGMGADGHFASLFPGCTGLPKRWTRPALRRRWWLSRRRCRSTHRLHEFRLRCQESWQAVGCFC